MRARTIRAAMGTPAIRRALGGLVGCPAGGWATTQQARRALVDELPRRSERDYGVDQLIDHALTTDSGDRYRWRDA